MQKIIKRFGISITTKSGLISVYRHKTNEKRDKIAIGLYEYRQILLKRKFKVKYKFFKNTYGNS